MKFFFLVVVVGALWEQAFFGCFLRFVLVLGCFWDLFGCSSGCGSLFPALVVAQKPMIDARIAAKTAVMMIVKMMIEFTLLFVTGTLDVIVETSLLLKLWKDQFVFKK